MCLHQIDNGFQLDTHFMASDLKSTVAGSLAWQGATPPVTPSDSGRLPLTK